MDACFLLAGIDEESLTDQELDARVRSIEGALRGLPDGSCLYQYARVLSGFDIPRQKKYSDPVTETFVNDRLTFLENTAGFRKIALHWCLTFEPSQKNPFDREAQREGRRPCANAVESSKNSDDSGIPFALSNRFTAIGQRRSVPILFLSLQS